MNREGAKLAVEMTNRHIDRYLTEEDKDAIRRQKGTSQVRSYPGAVDFQMASEV